MQNDRTGAVLSLLVLGTTLALGFQLGLWNLFADGAAWVLDAPLRIPSDLGAFVALAVLFVGTVALIRHVVAP